MNPIYSSHDPILQHLVREMTAHHGCHTVILYGSRARGDFTPDSDYDVAGIRAEGEELRIANLHDGKYLDGFIYPESSLEEKAVKLLKLRGGKVLVERDGFGEKLLATIETHYRAGPGNMPENERLAQRTWVLKTLDRARRGDIEGNFRRVWLLHEILAYYYEAQDRWYRGPKESFFELASADPATLRLYEQALVVGAPLESLERLVHHVLARTLEKTL